MQPAIAVIGMACRYPDARSPRELWENALAKRQAFRSIPEERLRVEDYAAPGGEDTIYCRTAALLEDYQFDRERFRVASEAFQSTDMAHWLALDVANQAFEDARLISMESSLREQAGVYIGNSLTGEFSRANLLRLRWPFVRRALEAALEGNTFPGAGVLIGQMERLYKSPFPATSEESLAGALSNTISGRIANHFDLKGGAYTVDGACASSLLAVATACSALSAGDVAVALAGGVDLSLDPFELAGFSSLGALARERMLVYDERSSGFWPGEGCGMAVLMRYEDALTRGLPVMAVLRGWGVSSDGSGGIARPELSGQLLALRRAYQRAGYGIETVGYFEGHGTGTTVGDATELAALTTARSDAASRPTAAVLSTSKTNIGHTKAAAGIAGLIRAVTAVHTQVLPPLTNCDQPRAILSDSRAALRVIHQAELWPADTPLRAGVSAMGFGGINVHITLEAERAFRRRPAFTASETLQIMSEQDCELFLLEAPDANQLRAQVSRIREFCRALSRAELTDLAVACGRSLSGRATAERKWRAALVAGSAAELDSALGSLDHLLAGGVTQSLDISAGVLLCASDRVPRIGFLFPGQGSPVYADWGIWARRFPVLRALYDNAALSPQPSTATEVAQPAICAASLAGLQVLAGLDIQACVAVGHSLGELTAYYWAEAMDSAALLELARVRGRAMAELAPYHGAMASLRADPAAVEELAKEYQLAIAAHNSPRQTVVSGRADLVDDLLKRARAAGIAGTRLPVSHAFHSPMVDPAATTFRNALESLVFDPLRRPILSTITGSLLDALADLRELLTSQVTSRVRFQEAIQKASSDVDLFLEVGPGEVLAGIARECVDIPIVALDSGGNSLRGLLLAGGAAFALGAPLNHQALFADRFSRPFSLNWTRRFLRNPCESPLGSAPLKNNPAGPARKAGTAELGTAVDVLRDLIARRAELPIHQVKSADRFLAELHLNSIAVSQIVLEAAKLLGVPPPAAPAEYSNSTVEQAAQALEDLRQYRNSAAPEQDFEGVAAWTRLARVDWVEAERRERRSNDIARGWDILSRPNHPLSLPLAEAFCDCPGSGVICLVPPGPPKDTGEFLLRSAQSALARRTDRLIFILQDNPAAAAFARSLWLEHPEIALTVIHAGAGDERVLPWAAAEARTAEGFVECAYDQQGVRREPRLELLPAVKRAPGPALSTDDILLVSGGGKGIAAECALGLARNSHCRLVLLGRSALELDSALAANLARFSAEGIEFRYECVDVTDGAQVRDKLRRVQAEWGSVTALLHAAGANIPKPIESLAASDLHLTLAPKLQGLENLLSSIDEQRLTTLVTFGSLIARAGMAGEADYAFANAALAEMAAAWQVSHPYCRCLNLEWSVWSGTGMGQRLGVIDSLKRQGIHPITVDDGVQFLQETLKRGDLPVSTIVTSRFGRQSTLRCKEPENPLLRFLEETRVHFPGVELIADADLSHRNDPYLEDHALDGEHVFPAVIGLEAMAQVARALTGSPLLPRFLKVRFDRPIVVSPRKSLRIRIAALQTAVGHVTVAIRSAETSFQADHFSAECVFDDITLGTSPSLLAHRHVEMAGGLIPEVDLYGNILFHQGRFQRVRRYRHLQARESVAEIHAASTDRWFDRHLPQDLVLGDPATRDAAIHSVQVCVPSTTLIPISVESIMMDSTWAEQAAEVRARERASHDGVYVYDLEVLDQDGRVRERWDGIRYRGLKDCNQTRRLTPALLVPHLERGFGDLLSEETVRIVIDNEPLHAREPGGQSSYQPLHRPDGKPELRGSTGLRTSISHAGSLTFTIESSAAAGCDVEPARERKREDWKPLLGAKGWDLAESIAAAAGESVDIAATRVWAARESLFKAGALNGETLLLDAALHDGWVSFRAGSMKGASCVVPVRGHEWPLVFAVMLETSPVHG